MPRSKQALSSACRFQHRQKNLLDKKTLWSVDQKKKTRARELVLHKRCSKWPPLARTHAKHLRMNPVVHACSVASGSRSDSVRTTMAQFELRRANRFSAVNRGARTGLKLNVERDMSVNCADGARPESAAASRSRPFRSRRKPHSFAAASADGTGLAHRVVLRGHVGVLDICLPCVCCLVVGLEAAGACLRSPCLQFGQRAPLVRDAVDHHCLRYLDLALAFHCGDLGCSILHPAVLFLSYEGILLLVFQ